MRIVNCFLFVLCIVSCKTKDEFVPRDFSKVEIETILQDSLLNVRAIEILKDVEGCFFATSEGEFGTFYKNPIDDELLVDYPITVIKDTIKLNFRAVAINSKVGFAITIGNPTILFKIKNDLKEVVYREDHPKAFYDAMDFWNDDEGIAIGDPTEDCMSIIITRDGGNTWTKLSCKDLPKTINNLKINNNI